MWVCVSSTLLEHPPLGRPLRAFPEEYTDEEILSYFDTKFRATSDEKGWWIPREINPLKRAAALKSWKAVLKQVPAHLRDALGKEPGELWRYSSESRKMMEKMQQEKFEHNKSERI